MADVPAEASFDEQALRADIIKVWGEFGAHVDVFDQMLKRVAELEAAVRTHRRKTPMSPLYGIDYYKRDKDLWAVLAEDER